MEIRRGDLSIAYERQGDGPTVLFLHNGGTSKRIWRPQMEALADRFDVVAMDLPGFGSSSLGSEPLTLRGYIEAVVGFISELDLAPLVIVGNCMGSNIATGIAEAHPEMVNALVLINPLTESTFDAGWIGPLHKIDRIAPPVAKALRSISRRIKVPGPAARLALRFQLGPAGVSRGVHKDAELIACNTRTDQLPALVDVLEDMAAYGQLDRGRNLPAVPVLTIWGARNRILSARKGAELNISLAPSEEVLLDGCGHLPMMEDPDAVTSAILQFLEKSDLAARGSAK